MKKFFSFALAVLLVCSIIGTAFASSGAGSIVAPDTFISWGGFGGGDDLVSLAVPSVAIEDRYYIVYKTRNFWNYLETRYIIDSFPVRPTPVEGHELSWIRYTGMWGIGDNAASPDSYSIEAFSNEVYDYSQSFFRDPLYANFSYYDSDGQLLIDGGFRGTGFGDQVLMELTLDDGTVISVPRTLTGNQFVVVRNYDDADSYKIWDFGTPDSVDGIYEGAEGVSYSTSVGSFVSGFAIPPYPLPPSWNVDTYPYFVAAGNLAGTYATARVFKPADLPYLDFTYVPGKTLHCYSSFTGEIIALYNDFTRGDWYWGENWRGIDWDYGGQVIAVSAEVIYSNFDLYDADGNLVFAANVSLDGTGSFEWSSWIDSTHALDLTVYGDIVYQTFDYLISAPDDDSSDTSDSNTPDASNNGLFPWLRRQWVFMLNKLEEIVDAIRSLSTNIDPYPDTTRPFLNKVYDVIFVNRVSTDEVSGVGGVLDKLKELFSSGYSITDLWQPFEDTSWFSLETASDLDSTSGASLAGDDDPFNHQYYYDHLNDIDQIINRGGELDD